MIKNNKNKMIKVFVLKFSILTTVFALVIVSLGSYFQNSNETLSPISADADIKEPVIVIDPGHGGEDGGAVANDGTVEKNLNLEYGKAIHEFCGLLEINSVMTRETDTLLYDKYSELDDYTGKKKIYDLKNRLRFAEEQGENTVFVGIHMNKFSDSKYSGTQIYFSPNNAGSMRFAEDLQKKVKDNLQKDNDRAVKKAGSSIFLLKRLQIPAVLVECGFLSNEAETARLKSGEYKKEFSLTTAVAIGEFINSGVK